MLVASTDGVGTKLEGRVAGRHSTTVGSDLVNHCVNDILVQGARPLFFLDYVATGKLEPRVLAAVVEGSPRLPRERHRAARRRDRGDAGLLRPGDYDVAGTIVGVVERGRILDGTRVQRATC